MNLICICSKSPNPLLYHCIEQLYKIQVDDTYKICVVDSDSDDLSNYDAVKQSFPEVDICFIKNKNYEYGAWKYALSKYPCCKTYFCIQDSNIIHKRINLDLLDDKNVYTFHHHSGYNSHKEILQKGIENLKNSGLNYDQIIYTNFNLAQHSSFIVNNKIMKDIFETLTLPPIDKIGSCFYERNFGIYFICKDINTHNLYNFLTKHHGLRN